MILHIKVIPKAKKAEFVERLQDGTLKIRVKAAPEKGKANEELIQFLSEALSLPREEILIVRGQAQKRKQMLVPNNTVLPW